MMCRAANGFAMFAHHFRPCHLDVWSLNLAGHCPRLPLTKLHRSFLPVDQANLKLNNKRDHHSRSVLTASSPSVSLSSALVHILKSTYAHSSARSIQSSSSSSLSITLSPLPTYRDIGRKADKYSVSEVQSVAPSGSRSRPSIPWPQFVS